jgi:hypothetical protein
MPSSCTSCGHTAASLAIQAGANIKAPQNMLGHESAGLTLDRYGHLYGSDVEAVGVAINVFLTGTCGPKCGHGRRFGRFAADAAGRKIASAQLILFVEPRGFESLTSALQRRILLQVNRLHCG